MSVSFHIESTTAKLFHAKLIPVYSERDLTLTKHQYQNTYLIVARLLGCLRMLQLHHIALDDVKCP